MEKSAQTQHGLWVENMIRAGLETMCIEHLKDDYFVLNPHPMEEITRHLLHFNDEYPTADCWNLWGSGVYAYSEYLGSGSGSSFDVPAHFYSSMDAICKRLLRVVKETSHLLKEATNNFVLSNATDEDREVKDQLLQSAHAAAEELLAESLTSGSPSPGQVPQENGYHLQLLRELRLLEDQVQFGYEMREVEEQAEVAAKALSEHMMSLKLWDEPADIADASTAMGETDSFFRSTTGHFRDTASAFRDTHNGFRDTGLTFKSGCSFTEVSICEVPAAGPKEDMLETILAEHNNLPEKMKQELDDFVADLESRRNKDEKKIGLLSVMQKTSTFRHDPDFRSDQWLDSFTATASE